MTTRLKRLISTVKFTGVVMHWSIWQMWVTKNIGQTFGIMATELAALLQTFGKLSGLRSRNLSLQFVSKQTQWSGTNIKWRIPNKFAPNQDYRKKNEILARARPGALNSDRGVCESLIWMSFLDISMDILSYMKIKSSFSNWATAANQE